MYQIFFLATSYSSKRLVWASSRIDFFQCRSKTRRIPTFFSNIMLVIRNRRRTARGSSISFAFSAAHALLYLLYLPNRTSAPRHGLVFPRRHSSSAMLCLVVSASKYKIDRLLWHTIQFRAGLREVSSVPRLPPCAPSDNLRFFFRSPVGIPSDRVRGCEPPLPAVMVLIRRGLPSLISVPAGGGGHRFEFPVADVLAVFPSSPTATSEFGHL